MMRVHTAHTADLDDATLMAAHDLMFEVFDDMAEDDWEHALGGIHALVWDGEELIGHASVIQRRMLHRGVALRCGYVEAVAVRESHRRQGHGAVLMGALEGVISRAYDLGALGATDQGAVFYSSRGWQVWRGPCSAITPGGVVPTPDEQGSIFVWPAKAPLDLDAGLTCDWRDGDVW